MGLGVPSPACGGGETWNVGENREKTETKKRVKKTEWGGLFSSPSEGGEGDSFARIFIFFSCKKWDPALRKVFPDRLFPRKDMTG